MIELKTEKKQGKVFDLRIKEAAKIYNLGLKEYIDAKEKKLKLDDGVVDKLKRML